MSGVEPTVVDFIGAFLLAGACGGVGASCGHVLVQWGLDWTPTTQLRRTASIGSVVAIGYPAAWVVALDAVRSTGLDDVSAEAPVGGGVPAVVATLALAVGLVLVIWSIRRKATDQTPWRKSGIVAFAAVYSTFLPVAFASLLPIVFPRLVL